MRQPEYFIEQVKYNDGSIKDMSPMKMKYLEWFLGVTKRMNDETIAVFKIYPKVKPAIAHYEHDIKATIIEG